MFYLGTRDPNTGFFKYDLLVLNPICVSYCFCVTCKKVIICDVQIVLASTCSPVYIALELFLVHKLECLHKICSWKMSKNYDY